MIIYFDTETTGLCPGSVIQLSYLMEEKGGTTGKNFFFCVPYVEPSAVAVHGFTPERLKELSGGKTFFEHLEEIDDDFRRADLTVAHNFPFDFKFMTAEFGRYERIFHFKESFDTMRYFTPVLKLPTKSGRGFKHPKLCELTEAMGVYEYDSSRAAISLFGDTGASHDARFDVSATYLAVREGRMKIEELDELFKKHL